MLTLPQRLTHVDEIQEADMSRNRDEAMRQSRRLHTAINQEREKVKIVLS